MGDSYLNLGSREIYLNGHKIEVPFKGELSEIKTPVGSTIMFKCIAVISQERIKGLINNLMSFQVNCKRRKLTYKTIRRQCAKRNNR